MSYTILMLFLLNAYIIQASQLNVSIYYEGFCPDSKRFITKNFYPTLDLIKQYLKVDLIPFGKATMTNSSGHWEFTCQHGPGECYANKVQSCVIALFTPKLADDFVDCAFLSGGPSYNPYLEECANKTTISWEAVQDCLTSGKADQLLAENGRKTESVRPTIQFIPTVIFNDEFNSDYQRRAMHNFLHIVCKLLDNKPEPCNSITVTRV